MDADADEGEQVYAVDARAPDHADEEESYEVDVDADSLGSYADAREDLEDADGEADDATVAARELRFSLGLPAPLQALLASEAVERQALLDTIEAANAPHAPEADDASDADDQEPELNGVPDPIGSLDAPRADDAPQAYSREQATMREFAEAYGLPDMPHSHSHLFSHDDEDGDYAAPQADHALLADYALNADAFIVVDADVEADDARSLACPLCRTVGGFVPLFEEEAEESW